VAMGRKFGYIGGGFTKGLKNEIKFKNTMGSILLEKENDYSNFTNQM
jgi:hypothetical protein